MPALDLPALLAPIAAALLPGWSITCAWQTADTMPMPGALATCSPTPTRSIAHVDVLDPWPDGESLAETLWHELTHALLSPLTALIPASDGAVMVEEQAVERLGVLLSKLSPTARAAVLRGVDTYGGAPLRARISALAPRARSGGKMDPKLITEALDAIEAGDAAKAIELLKGLIASAAGAPPGDAAPPSDAAPSMGKDPSAPAPGAPPLAAKMAPGAPSPAEDPAKARLAKEHAAIMKDLRGDATERLIGNVRARLAGNSNLASIERRILAAPDYLAAKEVAEFAIELGGGTSQRARSGVEHGTSPDTTGGAFIGEAADKLIAEGLSQQFVERYQAIGKADGAAAALTTLTRGRAALVAKRARITKETAAAQKAVAS